ncbi:hypothetical protein C1646_711221 [Rhizophagus diaphanus]|nr:hypothetical protein C1646_711221 [Rhizophagus diaphanus] [Rhizophagus sp. MUCL 43196]
MTIIFVRDVSMVYFVIVSSLRYVFDSTTYVIRKCSHIFLRHRNSYELSNCPQY